MKYNIGDKVLIKSVDWWNDNNDGKRICCGNCTFVNGMKPYCGKTVTIKVINKDEGHYRIFEDNEHWHWTDEMFAGLVEEGIIDIDDFQDDNEIIDVIDEYVHRLKNNECQINLPEGYQFTDEHGNVINATKIVLEKKSPKTDDIIKWLRECDMTKYIGVIYSGMCSITFDTEGLITDFLKTVDDDE